MNTLFSIAETNSLEFSELSNLGKEELAEVAKLSTTIHHAIKNIQSSFVTVCLGFNKLKNILNSEGSVTRFIEQNFSDFSKSKRSIERYLLAGKKMQALLDENLTTIEQLQKTNLSAIELFFANFDVLEEEDKKELLLKFEESNKVDKKDLEHMLKVKFTEKEAELNKVIQQKDDRLSMQIDMARRLETEIVELKEKLKKGNTAVEIIAPNQSVTREIEKQKEELDKKLKELQAQTSKLKLEKEELNQNLSETSQKLHSLNAQISQKTQSNVVWDHFNRDVDNLIAKYDISTIAALHYANSEKATTVNIISQLISFAQAIEAKATELKGAK